MVLGFIMHVWVVELFLLNLDGFGKYYCLVKITKCFIVLASVLAFSRSNFCPPNSPKQREIRIKERDWGNSIVRVSFMNSSCESLY